MTILLIGGYRFLGRAIVDAALERGHDVTAFNRGVTWPRDLAGVELVVGDRAADVAKLADRTWDVAIDTSGYQPSVVAASARALAGRVSHYTFVSTVSVYPWPIAAGTTEAAAVAELARGADPDGSADETYGERKVLCEREVSAAFGDRALLLRPGMIVGPHDETQRFTFWVARAARGGEMLVPGEASRRLQLVDVGDLARFALDLAERRAGGIVDATGPAYGLTWNALVRTCLAGTGSTGRATFVDDATLLANGCSGADFPWWISAEQNGIFELDLGKAGSLGLRCRPLIETVRRTWDWLRTLPIQERPAGLDPAREAELLAIASRS